MTTNLQLDARQRAMLAEMGVRVWQPSEAVQSITPVRAELALANTNQQQIFRQAQDERTSSIAVPVRREPPLRLPVLERPPAAIGSAPIRYVIGNLPDGGDFDVVLLGEPCTGDAERLLTNMMRVLSGKTFVAQMVASTNEMESLAQQLTKISAKVVLALGPHSAKALLGETSGATPFGKLRGMPHSVEGLKCQAVVTYHPLQLLRQPLAKAQAWLDLQQVLRIMSHA